MEEFEKLEYLILQWHLKKGLKLFEEQSEDDVKWTFKTFIESEYKRKILRVFSIIDGKTTQVLFIDEKNAEDMYVEATKFFRV